MAALAQYSWSSDRETVVPPVDFAAEETARIREGTPIAEARRLVNLRVEIATSNGEFVTAPYLRVSAEVSGTTQQESWLASLVGERDFIGVGETPMAAVQDLAALLLSDFQFYQSTPESEMTADAVRAKKLVVSLFKRRERG